MTDKPKPYHHGDLRPSLLREAAALLASDGIEGLSLRRLGERLGVSRTALYHHFGNKQALLCALAEQGFAELDALMQELADQVELAPTARYAAFARRYLHFATGNPARYGLMFGHTLWRTGLANEALKAIAYDAFRRQLQLVKQWQAAGILPRQLDSLRLAQVSWGALHGLAQLVIDGVYADPAQVDAMCQTLGQLFASA